MSSAFDAATFLDSTTTEALSRRPNIPAGVELIGIIQEPKARQVPGKKDPTQVYTFLDLPIELDLTQDPNVRGAVGQDKVTLTYNFMVDLNSSGAMDTSPGKNGRLRQLREALNLNDPGKPFGIRMLQGRQLRVKISHRQSDQDGEFYDQIEGIAKSG